MPKTPEKIEKLYEGEPGEIMEARLRRGRRPIGRSIARHGQRIARERNIDQEALQLAKQSHQIEEAAQGSRGLRRLEDLETPKAPPSSKTGSMSIAEIIVWQLIEMKTNRVKNSPPKKR